MQKFNESILSLTERFKHDPVMQTAMVTLAHAFWHASETQAAAIVDTIRYVLTEMHFYGYGRD